MKTDYLVWQRSNKIKNTCVLDELVGFDEDFELTAGTPLAANFPKGVHFTLHPDYPHNLVLIDTLNNIHRVIVGSKRLREFFEARGTKLLEFLPVGIMGHKKKLLSRDYAIVHPVSPVDCLKVEECGARFSNLVESRISALKRLVLDESRIEPQREIFRINSFFDVVMVRRDLAEAIDKEQFTGIRWVNPSNFPEN
jgi:hypothetical protein